MLCIQKKQILKQTKIKIIVTLHMKIYRKFKNNSFKKLKALNLT